MRSRCLRPPGQGAPALGPRSVQNGVYQSQYWPRRPPGAQGSPRWPPRDRAASGLPRPRPCCPDCPGCEEGPRPRSPGAGVSGAGKRSRGSGLGIPQADSRLRRLSINLGRSLPLCEPSELALLNASPKELWKGSQQRE